MKPRYLLLITLLLMLLLPASAMAEDPAATEEPLILYMYDIPEWGLRIPLQQDAYVITQDVQDDDPFLTTLGMDIESWRASMVERGCYLHTFLTGTGIPVCMLQVFVEGDVEHDFNAWSDDELAVFAQSMADNYAESGLALAAGEIDRTDGADFVILWWLDEEEVLSAMAITMYDGLYVEVDLSGLRVSLTEFHQKLLYNTIENIQFPGVQ